MARYDAVTQDLKDLGEEPTNSTRIAIRNWQQSNRLALLRRRIHLARRFCSNTPKNSITTANTALPPRSASRRARQTLARLSVEHLNALGLSPEAEAEATQGALPAFAFYKVVLQGNLRLGS